LCVGKETKRAVVTDDDGLCNENEAVVVALGESWMDLKKSSPSRRSDSDTTQPRIGPDCTKRPHKQKGAVGKRASAMDLFFNDPQHEENDFHMSGFYRM
jgi:hypothetical protein